jgi:hypothetical protein
MLVDAFDENVSEAKLEEALLKTHRKNENGVPKFRLGHRDASRNCGRPGLAAGKRGLWQ